MKRALLIMMVFAAIVGVAVWLFRGPLALRLYAAAVERALATDLLAELPDGLHVAFCGTGSPMPDPARAGPCTAIVVGSGSSAQVYVIDMGDGAAERLALMGIPAGRTTAVLLTHFHSDHIDGLGGFGLQRWVGAGARSPLPLVGPAGVEAIAAGLGSAYAADARHRVDHHGDKVAPPGGFGFVARPFPVPADTARITIPGEHIDLRVTAIRVDHDPVVPAVGYRFDYKGRCVTVSGDTAASPVLARAAAGCDLLVHEALQPAMTRMLGAAAAAAGNRSLQKIMADIVDYHTTPAQAAEIAARADVQLLVLTHIVPPLRIRALEGPFLAGTPGPFRGTIHIARDGDVVALPAAGGVRWQHRRTGW